MTHRYAHWAERIVERNIDERLKRFDDALVDKIAGLAGMRHLSFASKYVTYHSFHVHKNDEYVIYDSVVRRFLPNYLAQYGIKCTQRALLE